MKTIVIGCDNAGLNLKKVLINHMIERGIYVDDIGSFEPEDLTYYPLIAERVCEKIRLSDFTTEGILICGTGIGMAMTANKFKGIRAAVCHDIYSAERAKLSNNSNVICLGERILGSELAKSLLDRWLELTFKDGSSSVKLEAITKIENVNMK